MPPDATNRPDLSVTAEYSAHVEGLAALLLNSTAEGIYGIDLEGRVTFANPAALRMLGFATGDAFVGKGSHEAIHHTRSDGSVYPAAECRIYRVFRDQAGTHALDEVFWRTDGTCFPAEYWSYPLWQNGVIRGAVVTFIDITDRVALERTLRETEQRLRDALAEQQRHASELREIARFPEMNPGPVLRLDRMADIILANGRARELFGDTLVGRSWRDLCGEVDDALWASILAADAPISVESRLEDRDWVFAHRSDPESDLVFVFGADITAQKQAERALLQTEKMATLGTLAAGVAHELNNPAAATRRGAEQLRDAVTALEAAHHELDHLDLSVEDHDVLWELEQAARARAATPDTRDPLDRADREAEVEEWLEERGIAEAANLAPSLVRQDLGTGELTRLADRFAAVRFGPVIRWAASTFPVYALLHEIGQGATRISEIVRALKSYSFLGQAPIQAVDLHEGLDNTLIILRSKLKGGITVTRAYAPDLPLVAAYGGELNQVWTNLIDNAVDAMEGQGRLTLRTRRDGAWVEVQIEDSGPGIPAAIQPRVFDPFFTTKDPGKGTGLGLATCYSIVTDKHQGHISLTSRPGCTRFVVRLPLDTPPPPTGRSPGVSTGQGAP